MTDCFELLQEPRRPWLSPEDLKQKFFALSAACHPDRVHNATQEEKLAAQQRYTELNSAYCRLRDPKERVLHLLELELGSKPAHVQDVPAAMMDLAMEAGTLCREADGLLAQKRLNQSPLLQVQMFESGQQWRERLGALRERINHRADAVIQELKDLDASWVALGQADQSAKLGVLNRLEELYRLLSYFSRWSGQLQERIVELTI